MSRKIPYVFIFLFLAALTAKGMSSSHFTIRNISVAGNFKTQDRIVLIASNLSIGERILKSEMQARIISAQNNIQNTDLFNSVTVSNIPLNDSITELIITVTERWFIWPLPIFENADPNFNTWWERKDFTRLNYGMVVMHQNFRGRGEELGVLLQLGYSKRFGLLYNAPYASPKGKSGVSIYAGYDQQHEVTVGTLNNKRVFFTGNDGRTKEQLQLQLSFLQRHNFVTTQKFTTTYNLLKIRPEVAEMNPNFIGDSATHTSFLTFTYQFKKDKRDYKHYPLTGHYLDLLLSQNGIGINKSIFLTTIESAARKFMRIHKRFYGAIGIAGKTTVQANIPYFLQRGLGYEHQIRGYEYYVLDGNHYGIGKSNIKAELIPKKTHVMSKIKNQRFNKLYFALYANLFADVGYVINNFSGSVNSYCNQWLYSCGAGLDFLTYYDTVIRLEFSFNKQKESGFFLHFTQPI